jgi:UDP-N-acetylmuramyl pentapeptide synthase
MSALRLSDILRRDVPADPVITGVTADSRRVDAGTLFVALPGTTADGRAFIPQALAKGAAAVLAPTDTPRDAAPVLVTSADVRRAYALAARGFYGAQPKTCVAVTGTNGKTSVAAFCRQIWTRLGHASASMGTLGTVMQTGGRVENLTPPGLTSPDAGDAARLTAELAGRGVTHLALEASSHGIDQRRIDGIRLTAAGFTNLTQDHLDYHGDMEAYRAAKLRLFETLLPRGRTAVLNADSDAYSRFAAAGLMSGLGVYGVGQRGRDLTLIGREAVPEGQRLTIDAGGLTHEILLPLAGAFQASNALVAAGLCVASGFEARGRAGGTGAHPGRRRPAAARRRTGGRARGLRRLCAHAGRAGDGADGAAAPRARAADRGLRRRRRPRPRQTAPDGPGRGAAGRRGRGDRRQSPFGRPGRDPRRGAEGRGGRRGGRGPAQGHLPRRRDGPRGRCGRRRRKGA